MGEIITNSNHLNDYNDDDDDGLRKNMGGYLEKMDARPCHKIKNLFNFFTLSHE